MKLWLFTIGVVVAAFTAIGIYRAGLDEIPQAPSATGDQMVVQGGRLYGRRITSRSWSASYDRIVSNADQTIVDVYGVHDGVIYKKGRPTLSLRAQHMTVNVVTHDFNVEGPMHVETIGKRKRRSIDTDAASWSEGAGNLSFPSRVVIRSQSEAPLVLDSATFNVRTGDIDAKNVSGGAR